VIGTVTVQLAPQANFDAFATVTVSKLGFATGQ
jgi:hypothetical protein